MKTLLTNLDEALASISATGEVTVRDEAMAEAVHSRVAHSIIVPVTADGYMATSSTDTWGYSVSLSLTPEDLTADPSRVPRWAVYATAVRVYSSPDGQVDAYDLYRSHANLPPEGMLVGCMYDIGNGYTFAEGASIADGEWKGTPLEGRV